MQPMSFKQVAATIAGQDPRLSWLVRGEIGIGKSSLAKVVAEMRTQLTGIPHKHLWLDCANLSEGDLCIPMPREIDGALQTVFAPNALFGVGSSTPLVLVLDEYLKASKPVQDALNPVLEARRVGGYQLPEGSIVIATGNLAQEGVGDRIQPHTLNRLVDVQMRKPTSDEWVEWAMSVDIAPEIIAFVRQFPTCFQSYTEGEAAKSNTYIFDPRHAERTAFVTPRSLERASWLVSNRKNIPAEGLLASLAGTAGEAFARDMGTMLTIADKLPPLEEVFANPTKVKVPDNKVAQLILGLNLIRVTKPEQADAFLTFIDRLAHEIQMVLLGQVFANTAASYAFMSSPVFRQRAEDLRKYVNKV